MATPCLPIETGRNDAVAVNNVSVMEAVRDVILPRAVPLDGSLRDHKVRFFENESQPGVYTLAAEGRTLQGRNFISRTYHVARGRLGNVIRYEVKDISKMVDLLAGGGWEGGVDASMPRGQMYVRSEKATITRDTGQSSSSGFFSPFRTFHRHSAERSLEALSQARQARWNAMQSVAFSAEAEVIGDPNITLNDYLEFRVYAGGTLATLGSPIDGSGIDPNHPRVMQTLSGVFLVVGYVHEIRNGAYTTSLSLVLAREQDNDPGDSGTYTDDLAVRGSGQSTYLRTPEIVN